MGRNPFHEAKGKARVARQAERVRRANAEQERQEIRAVAASLIPAPQTGQVWRVEAVFILVLAVSGTRVHVERNADQAPTLEALDMAEFRRELREAGRVELVVGRNAPWSRTARADATESEAAETEEGSGEHGR